MRRLIIEADGGSRGNPGPAGYGALVRDAGTMEVLATESEFIGIATNNVAEYSGLIAGLRAAARIDASNASARNRCATIPPRHSVPSATCLAGFSRSRRVVA